ncbi:MAG: thiolase domain-containing protein [Candidatus Daviesbacteria bacterium]|nr:thiolase domain-containing protein [Candidatus Daviesbacteria bacterium]
MKIKVKGIGLTKFGELWDKSLLDLALEASIDAIKDSGINKSKIDAVFVGNMLTGKIAGQDHLGPVITSSLGLNAASFRIEGACASGGLAVHLAVQGILAGTYKNILVVGAEKMTDASSNQITWALMGASSSKERKAGLTFPALYALMTQAHMQKYGTTRKQLAQVSVKNHYHASLNKKAQYPYEITTEKVLNSNLISYPITLFDSSPITDGAGAIMLSAETDSKGVFITGSAVASDTIDLSERASLTELKATQIASKKALEQAGVGIKDIKVCEVHDCFTIAEVMAMEDLGVCPAGAGGKFIEKGNTRLNGKCPINTSGGLKACGHPVGATGVKQIIEITEQLRKSAGQRQVKDADIGLTQNVGGTGATVVVHVLQNL